MLPEYWIKGAPNMSLMVRVRRGKQIQQGSFPPWIRNLAIVFFLGTFSCCLSYLWRDLIPFKTDQEDSWCSAALRGTNLWHLWHSLLLGVERDLAAPHQSWIWHWAKACTESSVSCHVFRTLSTKLPLSAEQLNTGLYPIDFLALKHMLNSLAELR